jgi:2-keto-3-deoxy-L-rhamnonate aldolase RhmA
MSRLSQRYAEGAVVLGTYAAFGTAREIEMLAAAGLDFIRIDGYKHGWPDEVVRIMVAACRRHGVTAWGRTQSDPKEIARYIALGVEALTIPAVASAAEAKAIVAATAGRPQDFLLGCQVESRAGLDNLEEIVRVAGVDMIHSGRTDLASEITPGADQFDPLIIATEEKIVAAAQAQGKAVALMYPLDARGEQYVSSWIARGVRIFALDNDARVLREVYGRTIGNIRAATGRAAGSR